MNFKYFRISALIPTILILAVLLQPISDWIVEQMNQNEVIKGAVQFVDALSTIGMISLVLFFINYIGWKWRIFSWLIDIPNLNGRYVGKLTSSFLDAAGQPTVKDCVLEVRQTASGIHINAYTGDISTGALSSKSETTAEQLVKQSSGFHEVFYIFSNSPHTLATQLNNHDGTARLVYYPDTMTLDGSYYNQRKNTGTITVLFESRTRIGRLKR